jgi:hypothetical protein
MFVCVTRKPVLHISSVNDFAGMKCIQTVHPSPLCSLLNGENDSLQFLVPNTESPILGGSLDLKQLRAEANTEFRAADQYTDTR